MTVAAPSLPELDLEKAKKYIEEVFSAQDGGSRNKTRAFNAVFEAWKRSYKDVGLVPLLPMFYRLRGKPYTLKEHFPLKPLFRMHDIPRRMLLKCGRQIGKSTVLAHQGVTRSALIPFFNTTFITPLYEQVRRFSQNYVRMVMKNCIFYKHIVERGNMENVLQRTLSNDSIMHFTFAFLDAERVRGLNNDALAIDEVQGLDHSFFPLIMSTMDASPWRLLQMSGTPLSTDNLIEEEWQASSMAEWAIPCTGCHHVNVATHGQDLMKMIGKEGLICSKCGKALRTETGYWLHALPHKRYAFTGLHVPQIIMPSTCYSYSKWQEILYRMENFSEFHFMTETMGESWDAGSKLVTKDDLIKACVLPWKNDPTAGRNQINKRGYLFRFLAIDWSGGGASQESLTAFAVLGVLPDGRIETIWTKSYPHSTDYYADALRCIEAFKSFGCLYLAHDFSGAGAGREQMLVNAGFPMDKIIPVSLVRAHKQKALMTYNPSSEQNVRHSFSLDKTRSLVYTSELIKAGYLLFPQAETAFPYVKDFLALTEETLITPRGSDIFLIGKARGVPDDVAQAINIGVCSIYHRLQKWPNVAGSQRLRHALSALREADPNIGMDRRSTEIVRL